MPHHSRRCCRGYCCCCCLGPKILSHQPLNAPPSEQARPIATTSPTRPAAASGSLAILAAKTPTPKPKMKPTVAGTVKRQWRKNGLRSGPRNKTVSTIKKNTLITSHLQLIESPEPSVDVINKFNYQDYYSDNDVYRKKVLEGYGYKFLRINRFNIGKNPVKTLDQRITQLVGKGHKGNNLLDNILGTVDRLQNGHMKDCPKCKELKNLDDFRDSSLITGYGRFCRSCKGLLGFKESKVSITVKDTDTKAKGCPKCGSRMVLRNGRYGPFFGCSKYPYCRGTRNCR